MRRNSAKKFLALCLALMLISSSFLPQLLQAYALSHPTAAVLEEEKDRQASHNFDYHGAGEGSYTKNEVIVELVEKPGTTLSSLNNLEEQFSLELESVLQTQTIAPVSRTSLSSLFQKSSTLTTLLFRCEQADVISLCDSLNALDEVEYAQPNFIYDLCDESTQSDVPAPYAPTESDEPETPPQNTLSENDWVFDYTQITSLWQNTSYIDDDPLTGYGMGQGITVAVIDTGCNTTHEDIDDNLWNDGNGHCGYYAHKDCYIDIGDAQNDFHGHGSHCCGIIAMEDNDIGYVGTAPHSKIIVLKADSEEAPGQFTSADIQKSLLKARQFGADIISMSLGGYNFDYSTYKVYQEVSTDCLIVAAAGNNSFDSSESLLFPAAYSCVIGVMAISQYGNSFMLADYSNYDTTGNFYKVCAPGTGIMSLDSRNTEGNRYKALSGTSMATPVIAGMTACYMSYIRNSYHRDWSAAQYQYKIENEVAASPLNVAPYAKKYHGVAFARQCTFKALDFEALFESTAVSDEFAEAPEVTFSNPVVEAALKRSMGFDNTQPSVDIYDIRRVGYLALEPEERALLTDYSDIAQLTGLNYLDLSDVSAISTEQIQTLLCACAPTLFYLSLTPSTPLQSLTVLNNAAFSNLYYLDISDNELTDISPLSRYSNLKTLIASNNQIEDISALSQCKFIKKIDLSHNQIVTPTASFASKMAHDIDLSYNELYDHTLLYAYKGAYYSTKLYEKVITINVSNNHLTSLTKAEAEAFRNTIIQNNALVRPITVHFEYANQTEVVLNPIPLKSYLIHDAAVTRETLCASNLNSILGFTPYPADANTGNRLVWSCSEPGYFDSEGNVLAEATQITSCRSLTVTATVPQGSTAVSVATGAASQSVTLTIQAPEIYSAALTQNTCLPDTPVYFSVVTNPYAKKLVLVRDALTNPSIIKTYDMSTATPCASDMSRAKIFALPDVLTQSEDSYDLYLYAVDSAGNFSTFKTKDICTLARTFGFKRIGKLTVTADSSVCNVLDMNGTQSVNRYGEAACFALSGGDASQAVGEAFAYTLSDSTHRLLGDLRFDAQKACGFFGLKATDYPSAKTGKSTVTVYSIASPSKKASNSVITHEPCVNEVSVRNSESIQKDGYVEYLVKTDTGATALKAYKHKSKNDLAVECNAILTASSYATEYGDIDSSYQYKLWSIKVPLSEDGTTPRITITAADALSDGSVGMNIYGSETPKTFALHNATVGITQLQHYTLAQLTGLSVSPSNSAAAFRWTCSEDGYYDSEGRCVQPTLPAISSTRTISVTCTAEEASDCLHEQSGSLSHTVTLTILVPQIETAYLSQNICGVGNTIHLGVLANACTDYVRIHLVGSSKTFTRVLSMEDSLSLCDGAYLYKTFSLGDEITDTQGEYTAYIHPCDAAGNYLCAEKDSYEENGTPCCAARDTSLGTLHVRQSVSAQQLTQVKYPVQINRSAYPLTFALAGGAANTYTLSAGATAFIGTGAFDSQKGLGYFGLSAHGYPSEQTGEVEITLQNTFNPDYSQTLQVQTVEPAVYEIIERNTDSFDTDGYIEYLVKTNAAATSVKAYSPSTHEDLAVLANNIFTMRDVTGAVAPAAYDSNVSFKIWSVRIPLDSFGDLQPALITAADALGDGQASISLPLENDITSFTVHDATVSRDALAGNTLASLCTFASFPENSQSTAPFTWTCSEPGFFDAQGNCIADTAYIDSTVSLSVTIKAPKTSYAKSTISGTGEQTVTLTILAPELYYAALTDADIAPGERPVRLNVLAGPGTAYIRLEFINAATPSAVTDTYTYSMAGATVCANESSLNKSFLIPSKYTDSEGEYYLRVSALDAKLKATRGSVFQEAFVYPYERSQTLSLSVSPDNEGYGSHPNPYRIVSRYGEACPITFSTLPYTRDASHIPYSIQTTASSEKHIGTCYYDETACCGCFGMPAANYPNAQTGTADYTVVFGSTATTKNYSVNVIAPQVLEADLRNADSYESDGYAEYLVKTNWGATEVKAYALYTTTDIAEASTCIYRAYSAAERLYLSGNLWNYKIWSVKVPLSADGSLQTVSLTAADPLSDGSSLTVPAFTAMESFTVHDITVTAQALCASNLSALAGFTYSPATAQNPTLLWSCSESGYFDKYGNPLIEPSQITSSRTLTLTATAPFGVGAKSSVTGSASQTILLTIHTPELYSASLCELVCKKGSPSYFQVVTNAYTNKIILKNGSSESAATLAVYDMSQATLCADNRCKYACFALPEETTNKLGNHELYLFPADESGGDSSGFYTDIASSQIRTPYLHLGRFTVRENLSATQTLTALYTPVINRCEQAAAFSLVGTRFAAKPEGEYALELSPQAEQRLGDGYIDEQLACGYFGLESAEAKLAQPGSASFTVKNSYDERIQKTMTVQTVAPQVTAVSERNALTAQADGYTEYLVKTNTAATALRAYQPGTKNDLSIQTNHLYTAFDSEGSYGEYNADGAYKLWSVKVALVGGLPPIITLTAADSLGEGEQTLTVPDTGEPIEFTIEDFTVSREDFAGSNIRELVQEHLSVSDNAPIEFTFSCTQDKYVDSDNNVIVSARNITTTRTLTFIAKAPTTAYYKSTVSGYGEQSFRITIGAPEIYACYLTKERCAQGDTVYAIAVGNTFCESCLLVLNPTDEEDAIPLETTATHSFSTVLANGSCKLTQFALPQSVCGALGTYELGLFIYDAGNNYSDSALSDPGRVGYNIHTVPYLGTLSVQSNAPAMYAQEAFHGTRLVNRCEQAAVLCNYLSENAAVNMSDTTEALLGGAYLAANNAYAYFGLSPQGGGEYPSAQTGSASIAFDTGNQTQTFTVQTVAPAVYEVAVNNFNTVWQDGYISYSVKTNTAATELKAYAVGTRNDIGFNTNHLMTCNRFTQKVTDNGYADYSAHYKNWSIQVPLDESGNPLPVTLTAADALGDGSITKTPAVKINAQNTVTVYPDENRSTATLASLSKAIAVGEGEATVSDCLNNIYFSADNASLIRVTNYKTGAIACDFKQALGTVEENGLTYVSETAKAVLENGNSIPIQVHISRPIVESLEYNKTTSVLSSGAKIYFTAKTYGADALTVKEAASENAAVVCLLTKEDTSCYTTATDEAGNEYTLWHFERIFDTLEDNMKTYVSASYTFDEAFTATSTGYKGLLLNKKVEDSADFSAWNTQRRRLSGESLETLAACYSDDMQVYNERLQALEQYVQQTELYAQEQVALVQKVQTLQQLTDALFGYTDYAQSLQAYATLEQSDGARFITAQLRALVQEPVSDTNCKLLSLSINACLERIAAVVSKADEMYESIAQLIEALPALQGEEIPLEYGVGDYTALKQTLTQIQIALEEGNFTDTASMQAQLDTLFDLFSSLHQHTFTPYIFAPADKTAGAVVLTCPECDECFSAECKSGSYLPTARYESAAAARTHSVAIAAPSFNIFESDECNYAAHPAGLRLSESVSFESVDTTQGLRFTASVQLPQGMDAAAQTGNCIVDYGFVYSQSAYISDISKLTLGSENVYALSVKGKNTTFHSQDNTLTFNLVINVKSYNWSKDYCARSYITYSYNGITFTVYDKTYSSRSVVFVANSVLQSESESEQAKAYCQQKILNNL